MQNQKVMYSQNQEELYILDYFRGQAGVLLDIGANDGKTFSNSLRLIEQGWKAFLVEPSPKAFNKLTSLHKGNEKVECIQIAIGERNCKTVLHESGWHLEHRSDIALVSTLKKEETTRWKHVSFNDAEVEVMDFKTFTDLVGVKDFDFITIDAEGMDWEILSQIDLTNSKMVCVETNSIETEKYIEYCRTFGMRLIYKNAENIIMAK